MVFTGTFPFLIVYLDVGAEIYVIAIAPARRRPGYWGARTPSEGRLGALRHAQVDPARRALHATAAEHLYETPLSEDQKLGGESDGRVRLRATVADTP